MQRWTRKVHLVQNKKRKKNDELPVAGLIKKERSGVWEASCSIAFVDFFWYCLFRLHYRFLLFLSQWPSPPRCGSASVCLSIFFFRARAFACSIASWPLHVTRTPTSLTCDALFAYLSVSHSNHQLGRRKYTVSNNKECEKRGGHQENDRQR